MVFDALPPARSVLEVLDDVRPSAETAGMPMIAISALDNVGDRALEAGADAFLRKPFLPDELTDRVHEMLDRR
jgi:DNA-binding response OmpR family regulator